MRMPIVIYPCQIGMLSGMVKIGSFCFSPMNLANMHDVKLNERNIKLTDGRYFGHCTVLSKVHHFPLKANVIDKASSFFSTSSKK